MNERYPNLDLLRAFAATAVVVYHVIEFTHWSAFPVAGPLLTYRIGWIGVDLFYVISGFVITRSAFGLYRDDPAAFFRRYGAHRLARIVPLYILTCALWIVLLSPDFFAQPALRTLWQLGSHLTFTHSFWRQTFDSINGVNWTLAIEMQFYFMVALCVPWLRRTPGWRIWAICIVIAWVWRATMFAFYGGVDANRLFTRVTQLPGALDEFGAGVFLAKLLDRDGRRLPHAGWAWSAGAVLAGIVCMGLYWPRAIYWTMPEMVIFWRTALSAFFLCVVAAAVHLPNLADAWPLRPIRYLGEVSYGIYLWHLFPIMMCLKIGTLSSPQVLAVTLTTTVVLAAASWHLFEKPILTCARRFGRPASALPRVAPARGT